MGSKHSTESVDHTCTRSTKITNYLANNDNCTLVVWVISAAHRRRVPNVFIYTVGGLGARLPAEL